YLSREGILPEINHRNAVPILDADTRFADFPYIVMPYYRNGTLADLVAQHPARLPEDRVRSLLQDLLAGLAAAHQRGIIHRDIKPSNVLLDDQGAAVVGDFGLSLSDSSLEGLRSIVQSGSWAVGCQPTIVGTLAYMAPEILEGKPATSASDVYSVGIILFEMLTGRRPNGVEFPEEVRSDLLESSRWRTLYAASCAHHSSGSGMLVQC
ncbi:MAG TPA: serine/threonine-protein kinase, partial [Phycisphaerae bacterium]|nr:serine/threonine-protein kinase [Phycisphaerae bacterium]